jgi:hypothetical protein
MAFISKEIPAGLINGINTVFTLSNPIALIDDIWFDGGIYLTPPGTFFTVGNTITLGNAPTVSLEIDYYTTPPITPGGGGAAPSYYSADINFESLVNLVLRELKEPEGVGSEAVTVGLVKDTINMVYAEAFNDQRMKQSARENNISFQLANDTTLTADLNVGDPTMLIDDAVSFLAAGRVLGLSEMIDYTTNDFVHTLGGLSGLQIMQPSGTVIRQMYPLTTLCPNIQSENFQYFDVNGIPQQYMEYPTNITAVNFYPNSYSIYKGFLIISRQSTVGGNAQRSDGLIIYTQQVVPLLNTTDIPTLIPNSWRIPILVYGAAMRIAASDAYKTSWDWWNSQYTMALSQYIAFKNCRVIDRNNKVRPILYNRGSIYR